MHNYCLKNIIKNLLCLLNEFIPKKKNRIAFASTPDVSDNSYAIYKYINNLNDNYELIWLISTKEGYDYALKKNIKHFAYKKSIKGIWKFIRAKYYMGTHLDCFSFKSKKQVWIELGHGTPFKSFLFSEKRFSNVERMQLEKQVKKIDYYITTSNLVSNIISANIKVDIEKTFAVGYPRNDILKETIMNDRVKNIIDKNIFNKTKIIVCPTFRVWEQNNRLEGKTRKNILGYDDFDYGELGQILENNNCVLLFKLHPFEEKYYIDKGIELPKNCYLITNKQLIDNDISLYDLLPFTDAMITDYSSVYFDYLLLNKPIIFNIYDIQKYSSDRGFILTPPENFMCGAKVYNKDQLIKEIINVCNKDDEFYKFREYINAIINENSNFNACEKIYSNIIKI